MMAVTMLIYHTLKGKSLQQPLLPVWHQLQVLETHQRQPGQPQGKTWPTWPCNIFFHTCHLARVVTGIIANKETNGIPFPKTNNDIFPLPRAGPLLNGNDFNNLINPNSVLAGWTGSQTNAILQNIGNNDNVLNGDNQPFVTAGQLPPGSLQRLMFGSTTVINDELTQAHELGQLFKSKHKGFYLAGSLDGTSQTIASTPTIALASSSDCATRVADHHRGRWNTPSRQMQRVCHCRNSSAGGSAYNWWGGYNPSFQCLSHRLTVLTHCFGNLIIVW